MQWFATPGVVPLSLLARSRPLHGMLIYSPDHGEPLESAYHQRSGPSPVPVLWSLDSGGERQDPDTLWSTTTVLHLVRYGEQEYTVKVPAQCFNLHHVEALIVALQALLEDMTTRIAANEFTDDVAVAAHFKERSEAIVAEVLAARLASNDAFDAIDWGALESEDDSSTVMQIRAWIATHHKPPESGGPS